MTWLAWRQQRATIFAICALLIAYVIAVVVLRQLTVAMIVPGATGIEFGDYDQFFFLSNGALLATAPVAGAFVGAPLFARDRELGTDVLALTQSVSATTRFGTKLVFAVVPVLVAAGIAQAVHVWWARSLRPFEPREFTLDARAWLDLTGPVPLAFTLFAVVLGATLGLVLGNTLSAMVLTFGIVLGLETADRAFLREHVGRHPELGGGKWVTLWPSAATEALVLVLLSVVLVVVSLRRRTAALPTG